MDFLPMPHSVQYGEGSFRLGWETVVVLENTQPEALTYAQLLQQDTLRCTGIRLQIVRGASRKGDIVLTPDTSLPENTYTLNITADGIRAAGGSGEALLNAVMTLCQCICRSGAVLPALSIRDWPDLKYRGYYLDCSRGRIPTMADLKRTADLLCRCKINEWQLYIEHTYLFRDMSECWRDDTPLTAQEILELDAYCRARHIELVPSLSTFGHMYGILRTRSYTDLCEMENSTEEPWKYMGEMAHHTINTADEASMPLIKQMISEFLPLFTSRRFNICCDETFDLGKYRGAAAAEKLGGVRELYIRHVAELCSWLIAMDITPIFWGDIILKWPEAYNRLPKETVCLNWHYEPDVPETEIRTLAEQGSVQYVCPGVQTWNRFFPQIEDSYLNISAMCAHGHKYGAIGLLNTDWGDYGQVCDPRMSVPGILYGAAFAWNSEPVSFEELNKAISLLEYGDRTGGFIAALAGLCKAECFRWLHVIQYMEAPERRERIMAGIDVEKLAASHAVLEQAVDLVLKASLNVWPEQRGMMQAVLLSAEAADLSNAFGAWLLAEKYGRDIPHEDGPSMAARWEKWLQEYMREWRTVSREGNAYHLREMVCRIADLLRGGE